MLAVARQYSKIEKAIAMAKNAETQNRNQFINVANVKQEEIQNQTDTHTRTHLSVFIQLVAMRLIYTEHFNASTEKKKECVCYNCYNTVGGWLALVEW